MLSLRISYLCLALCCLSSRLLAADWELKPDPPAEEFKLPEKAELSLPIKVGVPALFFPTSTSRFVLFTQQDKPGEDVQVVYDLQTMKEVGRLTGRLNLMDLVLSPDGAYVAGKVIGGAKPTVEVYSVSTGKSVNKIEVDPKFAVIKLVDFAAGDQLVTAKQDGLKITYRTWDIKTGKQGVEFQSAAMVEDRSEAFSPGRKCLAIASDGKLTIFDLAGGKSAAELVLPKPNEFGKYNCKALTFSPDGKSLAALLNSVDSRILTWDIATGKPGVDHTLTGNLQQQAQNGFGYSGRPLEWLPDQSGWLAYGQLMIDAQSGKIAWKMPVDGVDPNPRRILDNDHVLSVTGDFRQKKVALQALPRKEIDAAFESIRSGKDPSATQLPAAKTPDWSAVRTVPIPSGSVEWKATIDAAAKPGKTLAARPLTIQGKTADIAAVLFSAGDVGQVAVITVTQAGTVSNKKQVHIDRYDLAEGKSLGGNDLFVTEPAQGRPLNIEADVSPDASAVIVKEPKDGKRVDVWSLDQGKHVAGWMPFEKETDSVVSWLAFVDAKRVLTANAAGKLVLWSLPECKAIYTTTGCQGALALSPARQYLAAYNGATFDLIDAASGERRGQLTLPSQTTVQRIEGVAFRPDGKALAAMVRRTDFGTALATWDLKADAAPSSFLVRQPGKDLQWAGAEHILIGQSLVDLKSKVPLASYIPPAAGRVESSTPDGRCWFHYARNPGDPVLLVAQSLPDTAAKKLASQIADKTAQPVYMPGMTVKIKIDGATPSTDGDAFRKKITERLTSLLQQSGLKVADDGDLVLTANVQPEHATGNDIEIREIGGIPKKTIVPEKEVEVRWLLADSKGTTLFEQKGLGRMQGFGTIPGSADPAAYLTKTMWDNAASTLPPLPGAIVRLDGKFQMLPKPVTLTGD